VRDGGALERLVAPWPLLVGVVASFLGCCAWGAWYSRHNVYENFERFHLAINPLTLHYPTAPQVLALARSRLPRDKVAVIVGGNSIPYGVGQRSELLWSKALQAALGDDYRVLNLALPGAAPSEFAGTIAEALSREHPKVLFVTVTGFAGAGWPDGTVYQYFYWDAWANGLLQPCAEREKWLREPPIPRDQGKVDELRRQGRLNAHLYFNDLWNALAYTRFSTVWTFRVAGHMFRPRKRFLDWEPPSAPLALRYPAAQEAGEMERLRGWVKVGRDMVRGYPLSPGQPDVLDPKHSLMCRDMRASFPEPCRARTLVLIPHNSPHYVGRLTPAQQEVYRDLAVRQVRILEAAGFASLEVGRHYTEEDFIDGSHLSESGGLRLAAEVAPKVRELARRLGYLREGGRP
jgi:hypothetical protein